MSLGRVEVGGQDVSMLGVGLTSGPSFGTVRDRLVELGAVQADGSGGSVVLDDPGVFLVEVRRDAASLHLVVEVVPPDPGERGAGVRAADVVIEGWSSRQELVAMIDVLWAERLVPFERNVRANRRAPRRRVPVLAGPDARWPSDAARLMDRLHAAVGELALRIDHIGSTSVPGLRAKDLIDIQVTVRRRPRPRPRTTPRSGARR